MAFTTILIILIISCTNKRAFGNNETSETQCLNCKNDTCSENRCTFGCKEGYFGRSCSSQCSPGCKNKICSDSVYGDCTDGCVDGFWGDTCKKHCSSACEKCHRQNGTLCYNCDGYHYGETCETNCYQTCPDTGCNRNGTCRKESHTSRCGHNCIDCNEITGFCKQCKIGYGGRRCVYCKQCSGRCSDEGCTEGCVPGYHGATCLKPCSDNCDGNCYQLNGTCNGCKSGYHGETCAHPCGSNCLKSLCSRSGSCSIGCEDGFYGASCDVRCKNCFSEKCHQTNGHCTVQCKDGYYGDTCNKKCDESCDCNRCNRQTGYCIKSPRTTVLECKIGPTENANTTNPSASKSDTPTFLIIGSIGILVLCSTVAGLLIFKFCKSPCFAKRRQTVHSVEETVTRDLPNPPEDYSSSGYYVIHEDELDASNQSNIATSQESQCLSVSIVADDPRQCPRPTSTSVSLPSPLTEEDNDETVTPLTCDETDGNETENLQNIQEMLSFHNSSRALLLDNDLISSVENTSCMRGVISRQQPHGQTQLCIPKQYLSPITQEESQF